MNNNSSGLHREMMNARGYEKFDGVHYGSANIVSSVTSDTRTKIVSVSAIMVARTTKIIDVKVLLLHG